MDRDELAASLMSVARVNGQFRLRSGTLATEYFDEYRFESNPRLLRAVGRHLAPLVPAETEALAGLELGGAPIAAALSLETNLPVVFVRKEAKSYGTCRIAEGLICGSVTASTQATRKCFGVSVSPVLPRRKCSVHPRGTSLAGKAKV